ncbi:MAG: streptomycin biosynthesis enzyme StrG [Actinobacteria bacterium]|nr:streptomycin biosynthesis enzyme StrG [Actinomycetota bacterium]
MSTVLETPELADRAGVRRPVASRVRLGYDTEQFPFAALLRRDVFKVRSLERLHEEVLAARVARGQRPVLKTRDNLSARELVQRLPDSAPFFQLYHRFMRLVLAPVAGRSLSYSNRPKVRVHFPGTASVSSFHADVPVTKRVDQINFWLPVTSVTGGAALHLESDYGLADYAPEPVRYGQALIFDGGYLGHGSVDNDSEVTRVSFDMRFGYRGATTREEGIDLMNRIVRRLERLSGRN